MANDSNKASWVDANWRNTAWIVLASVSALGAIVAGGFFGMVLLAGAIYSGFKAYQAKKDEQAAIMNSTTQPVLPSPAEAMMQQQPAIEPAQQPTETKWQATVTKSSSPTPGVGRGA